MDRKGKKIIAQNRKAYHDYFVEETYEAGIELFGTEVKSIRQGAVNLKDSFCSIYEGEIFSDGIRISPYEKGNIFNKDPMRKKRLLMHKKEILKLWSMISRQGYAIIPLSLYFSGSKVKVEIGVCKGKRMFDKRECEAKAQATRDIERFEKSTKDF